MTLTREPDWGAGAGPEELAAGIAAVRPGFGEYLGAQVREGFWATTTGQGIAQVQKRIGGEGEAPLTAEEWRQSKWFRPSVPFDEAMTPARAQAVAETFDANEYRRWLISQRKAGIVEGTAGFAAGVVGSIPDPVNFIPFFGPAYRAATVARFGAIGGRALLGAGEAALGTAIAQPFLMTSRQQFGDDVTLADAMLDIALSAFAGAAIGGASGVWSRATTRTVAPKGGEPEIRVEPRAPEATARDPIPDAQTQEAASRAMNMAMRDLAEGRTVDVGALPEMRAAMEATRKSAQMFYHGTMFDVTPENIRSGPSTNGLIYVTKDPAVAGEFARGSGYAGAATAERRATFEVLAKDFPGLLNIESAKVLDTAQFDRLARAGDFEVYDLPRSVADKIDDPATSLAGKVSAFEDALRELYSGGRILPVRVLADKPFNSEASPLPWREADSRGAKWFQERGFDSVWVDEGRSGVSLAVFSRDSLRSPFALDFSPGAEPDIVPRAAETAETTGAVRVELQPQPPAATPAPARRSRGVDTSTLERIRQMGGVRLDGVGSGDAIAALGGKMRAMSRLRLSKAGKDLDRLRGDLAAEGYTRWDGKPLETVDDLVRTIAEEVNGGNRIVGASEIGDKVDADARRRFDALVDQYGQEPDIRAAEEASLEEAFNQSRAIADSYAADYARLRAEAAAFLKTRGEAWEPEWAPEGKPVTLADLERINAELGSREGAVGRGADAGDAGPAGRPADAVRGASDQGGQGGDSGSGGGAQAGSAERRELIAQTQALLSELQADPRFAEAAQAVRSELARLQSFDGAADAAARCLKG